MKDKEMIEEMAKEIEKAKQHIWASVRTQAEDEDYLWHSRAIAEHLMLQGYRKLPKDSVVLSKEELSKRDYEFRQIGYDECLRDNPKKDKYIKKLERKIDQLNAKLDQSRKETAEKFLQLAYDRCLEKSFIKKVEELAEQFGVEIKE